MMRRCPLCHAQEPALYHQDRRRDYYQCATCALVFVPSEQHLTAAAEKAEYDQHQTRRRIRDIGAFWGVYLIR
ncbi:hypothetical protein [Vreelandella lionensis]|uniref:hypothetical protein n=1 Tax=Vreelandella lionensis TaxID=1144478 RepID=UPI0030F442DA